MKAKRFLSIVLTLAMAITTFSALPLTANASDITYVDGSTLYSNDFSSTTEYEQDTLAGFKAWRTVQGWQGENSDISATNPLKLYGQNSFNNGVMQTWYDSDPSTFVGNRQDPAYFYPLSITPKTGVYAMEVDIKSPAEYAAGTNWEGAVFYLMVDGASLNGFKLMSSAGAYREEASRVDTVSVYDKTMTIDPTQWIKVRAIYDCTKDTVTVTASQGEASVTGTSTFTYNTAVNPSSPAVELRRALKGHSDTAFLAGACFDNFKVIEMEPVIVDGTVFYSNDFSSTTEYEQDTLAGFKAWRTVQGWQGENSDISATNPLKLYGQNSFNNGVMQTWYDSDPSTFVGNRQDPAYFYPLSVTPRTGVYAMEVDIKSPAEYAAGTNWEGAVFYLMVDGASLNGFKLMSSAGAYREEASRVDTVSVYDKTMTIDPTQWIKVRAVYDCTKDTVTVTASQGEDSVTGSSTFTYTTATNVNPTSPAVELRRALKGHSDTAFLAGACFDNFKVVAVVEEPEDNTGIYTNEDFESETDATSWVAADENRNNTPFQTWNSTSYIEVVTGNDNNYLSVVKNLDVFPLSQTTKDGKYKFEFNIKPHSYTCSATNWIGDVYQVSLGGTGNDYHAIAIGSSSGASLSGGTYPVDKLTLFESQSMTISEAGGWIHIEVEYDCETSVITATATDEQGTTITATKTMATVSSTSPKCTFTQCADFGAAYIDNIKISDVVETEVPVVNASNIKIYAGDDEQNAAKASAFTDRVVIDFGQSMYTDDMNDSLIYIVNKTTSEKVAYEGTYSSKVYTMDFEEALSVGTTYTIHVGEVRNNGMLSSDVYELDFTVKSGIFAELIGVKQNNVVVESASSLTAGAATIELKYSNSTNTNKIYVIVAYYKDDTLVNFDYVEQPINTNQPTTTLDIDYTVPAIDGGFDEVNVMAWENFVNLVPVCDNIVF